MSSIGIGVLVVIAAVIAPPAVLLIPHARQSPTFSRLLWLGTFIIAFLGGWLGLGYSSSEWATQVNWIVGDTPVFPILVGEVAAVLALNVILWVLDRLDRPGEEIVEPSDEAIVREQQDRTE